MKIRDICDENKLRNILAKNILAKGILLPKEIIKDLVSDISDLEVKLTIDIDKLVKVIREESLERGQFNEVYFRDALKSKAGEIIRKE